MEQVKEYEASGAKLEGYAVLRKDINFRHDFPNCVYAILNINEGKFLFVSEKEWYKFNGGWDKHKVYNHCWWEETELDILTRESFKFLPNKGFWL